jgi:hypothetical protein
MATQPQWMPEKDLPASSQSMMGRSKGWVRRNQKASARIASRVAIQTQVFFVCFQIWLEIRFSPPWG